VNRGAREANPMMEWAVGTPAAFYAIKAATTVGTLAVVEHIRKKHPKRALAFIIAIDAAYSAVVIHNYRVLSNLR
jgi:hypothetical protein